MNTVSHSFYQDIKNANSDKADAAKGFTFIRICKNRTLSHHPSDRVKFATYEEAQAYGDNLRKLNPTKSIDFVILTS